MQNSKNVYQTSPSWITILKRRGPLLFNNLVIAGQSRKYFQEMLGFDFEIQNFKYIDGEISIDKNEVDALGTIIIQMIEQNPLFLREFICKCETQCKKLLKLSKQISKLAGKDLTNNDLRGWFEKYIKEVLRMMPFLNIFAIMEKIFDDKISVELKEKLKLRRESELLNIYLKDLVFSSKENYVVKELDKLVDIAAEIQKKPEIQKLFEKAPKEVEEGLKEKDAVLLLRLNSHTKTFGFLTMYAYEGNPMTVADVIVKLKALLKEDCSKKRQEIKQRKQKAVQKYGMIINKLQISGDLLQLIEYTQEYLYFRLYRLDMLFMAGFHARNLLKEIGKRMNLSYDDVINLWHEEILDFFTKDIMLDRIKIKERKQGYATIFINGKLEIIAGKGLANLIRRASKENYKQIQKIEGVVASVGKHIGPVKIVVHVRDISKVKHGDVLVSTITNPYYMPAMIRAGAIVTDEGGILSHAAIVSREFNKPCVIGTNIATKVLKHNDIIEVDATGKKGVIRKIK